MDEAEKHEELADERVGDGTARTSKESWGALRHLVEDIVEQSCNGVEALRREWAENKGGLIDLFPERLRVERRVAADDVDFCLTDATGDDDLVAAATALLGSHPARWLQDYVYSAAAYKHIDAIELVGKLCCDFGSSRYCHVYADEPGLHHVYRLALRELFAGKTLSARPDPRQGRSGKFLQSGMRLGAYIGMMIDVVLPEYAPMVWASLDSDEVEQVKKVWQSALAQAVPLLGGVGRDANTKDAMTMVLSVDPLDMITASLYTTGWRSCYNLIDGEYRAAPLAYICDPCTAIAYAYKSTSNSKRHGVVVPTKAWRMWVHLDPEDGAAILGRPFPESNAINEAAVRSLTAGVLARSAGIEKPHWLYKQLADGGCVNLRADSAESDQRGVRYFLNHNCSWVYDDDPTYGLRLKPQDKDMPDKANIDISVGAGEIPCLVCGSMRDDNDSGVLCCESCGEPEQKCDSCGRSLCEDEVYYTPGEETYCRSCWEDVCANCWNCNNAYWQEDVQEGTDGHMYCQRCWDKEFVECDQCGSTVRQDDAESADGDTYCQECYERLFANCDECGEVLARDNALTLDGNSYCEECHRKEVDRLNAEAAIEEEEALVECDR